MIRPLLILLVIFLQVACAPPQKPTFHFTGQDVVDRSGGLIVIGEPALDRIFVAHYFGEFRVQLPYATDWVFQPVSPPLDYLKASSPSQGLHVTIRSYDPGRDRTGAWPPVEPESYLRDEILVNVATGFRRRFGVELDDVRVSNQSARPVLEYDLVISEPASGGGAIEISQHNLWAMRQRESDGVVLDLHVSVTVPVEEAGGADLMRLHRELAEMIGEGFIIHTP